MSRLSNSSTHTIILAVVLCDIIFTGISIISVLLSRYGGGGGGGIIGDNLSYIDTGTRLLVAMALAKPKLFEMWEWSDTSGFLSWSYFHLRPVYRQIVTSINL